MTKQGYNTDGKNTVLDFFKAHRNRQFTADDVMSALKAEHGDADIKLPGKSSLYRIISNFTRTGALRCFVDRETSKKLYQYADEHCENHFHLKCSECGQVVHLECEISEQLLHHISSDHGFSVSAGQSILLGECAECQKKKEKL